jgi:uncharacterized protein YbaA (DUF1428 family)
MKRRIVQRIENQRWIYVVQQRRWIFFWRDYHTCQYRHTAMETVMTLRARDDYGGHMPWEGAKLIQPRAD